MNCVDKNVDKNPVTFLAKSEQDTRDFAAHLARRLSAGSLVALHGELGAGKTRFVQGFAEGLGVPSDHVMSPTFVIHHVHQGRCRLHHLDVYRLRTADEFWDLGGEEFLADNDAIVLVEWAERIQECLPDRYLDVDIRVCDPETRQIVLQAVGAEGDAAQQAMRDYAQSHAARPSH